MTPIASVSKLPSAPYDNKIYAKFSAKTIEKKAQNKEEFQKEFGLIPESKVLLLGSPIPLTENNGAELLEQILPGIEAIGIQLALMGIGTTKYQRVLTEFAAKNEASVVILENTEENLRKMYASADSMLFLANNQQIARALENALSYGIIPIAEKNAFSDFLIDYNPNQEKGNSFLFRSYNLWQVFACIVRATENFRFPYDWKNMAREAMNTV